MKNQWPTAAEHATRNGMHTVSRVFPVRNGYGELVTPGNGLRITRMPTMLDIGPTGLNLMTTGGKFCGPGRSGRGTVCPRGFGHRTRALPTAHWRNIAPAG